MGLFSKFRENAGDEVKGEQSSGEAEAVGLIAMLENVREAVMGSSVEGDSSALPRGLAMEDPFSQSDHVLPAVVEHDVRASGSGSEERRTIVQTVRESLTQSAHVVRDAVLSHTTADQANGDGQFAHAATPIEDDGAPEEQTRGIIAAVGDIMAHPVQTMRDMIGSHTDQANGDSEFAQAATPIEDGVAPEEQSRGIIASVGDIMAHPVQTMKDIIGSHSDVVEASSGECSAGGAGAEQTSNGVSDHQSAGEEEQVKGLIQTVKDAAMEVKEEMLEVVQEVKDVVMSSDTLPNVQTESITEDAGERPSMELVHTIVHD